MQKKIIALAIAAAVSAPAFADSNATIYGVANLSYDMTQSGAVGNGFSNNKVSSNTSRIGFKGTEDLGDGLAAAWQIETLVQMDGTAATATNGANQFGGRNTYLGLAGGFGTVLMGRHDTPYNISNRKYDLFGDGLADNRSIMGGGTSAAASFNGRQPNVLAYISPAMSGFTGAIAYVAGAEGQTLSTQTKGSAWSMAALYGNGPISANFGYEVHTAGSAPGTLGLGAGLKETAWTISGGYKVAEFEINGIYEKTDDNFTLGANTLGHRAYYLAGKYNFGSNAVKLAYANAGANAAANTDADQITVGFDHSLSKRTTVYALYTKLSNGTVGTYALSGNGTGAPAAAVSGAGGKPSAVSLGMKHTF